MPDETFPRADREIPQPADEPHREGSAGEPPAPTRDTAGAPAMTAASAAEAVDHDVFLTLDLALRIGEMLLANGAGAADVSATMLSITRACGLEDVTPNVTFTDLALNHRPSPDRPGFLQVRTVKQREIDYADLTLVDHLVDDLLSNRLGRVEARERLREITHSGHDRPRWAISAGWGLVGSGTALLVGGNGLVTAVAFVAAVCIDRLQLAMSRRRYPAFYQQVAGGLVASLIAVGLAVLDVPVAPHRVVTAAIILLLAGVGYVGATQDALTGFPLTANARVLEALLATAGIIAGVSGGLTIGGALGVDLGLLAPVIPALSDFGVVVPGAALAASAFAYAAYAPVRVLVPVALIGAFGQVLYTLQVAGDLSGPWATATAAVAIGVLSSALAPRLRVPPLVIVVSATVPLLPGLTIYRGLFNLSVGDDGTPQLVAATATAIALAAGAILGQYLAQPLRREFRGSDQRLSGPRLVGPVKLVVKPVKKAAAPVRRVAELRRDRRTPPPGGRPADPAGD